VLHVDQREVVYDLVQKIFETDLADELSASVGSVWVVIGLANRLVASGQLGRVGYACESWLMKKLLLI
jgi:hypothetical protein